MDKIKYNENHEAYEITYNVWGKPTLVLFFTDDQQEILDNLSEIAVKLDKINSRKAKFAEIMIEGKWYNRSAHLFLEASELAEAIFAAYLSVDFDDGEIYINIEIAAADDYLGGKLAVEVGIDNGIEVLGWSE